MDTTLFKLADKFIGNYEGKHIEFAKMQKNFKYHMRDREKESQVKSLPVWNKPRDKLN